MVSAPSRNARVEPKVGEVKGRGVANRRRRPVSALAVVLAAGAILSAIPASAGFYIHKPQYEGSFVDDPTAQVLFRKKSRTEEDSVLFQPKNLEVRCSDGTSQRSTFVRDEYKYTGPTTFSERKEYSYPGRYATYRLRGRFLGDGRAKGDYRFREWIYPSSETSGGGPEEYDPPTVTCATDGRLEWTAQRVRKAE